MHKFSRGFTLVEVVIVLTVMALLAVAALPRIVNIVTQAKAGARDNIVAAVRSGISVQKVSTVSESTPLGTYPVRLDPHAAGFCSNITPCFTDVLEPGQDIRDTRWDKLSDFQYRYDNGGSALQTFTYNAVNGTFNSP